MPQFRKTRGTAAAAAVEARELSADPVRARGLSKLEKLLAGRQHTRKLTLPNSDEEFVMRVVGGATKQLTTAAAIAHFEDIGIPPEFRHFTDIDSEIGYQHLSRAMRDPDVPGERHNPYPEPFATVDELREILTLDERDILLSQYFDLEESVDPDPAFQSEQWHDEIMSALKKSPEQAVTTLSSLGSRTLIGFLVTMVAPLLTSPTASSSSGQSDIDNPNSSSSISENDEERALT